MDDDDAFLYGDDDNPKQEQEVKVPETPVVEQEEPKHANSVTPEQQHPTEEDPKDQSMEESEYESDSDIEFIIGDDSAPAATTAIVPPTSETLAPAATITADTKTAGGITVVPALNESMGLDINKVGSYNDIPVDQIALEELADKPWRLPGADLTDYFNFGFDEVSWTLYCSKQEQLRREFDPNTLIPRLISSGVVPPSIAAVMKGEANQGKNTQINANPMPFMMPGMMPMNMFNNNQMNPMMGMMQNMQNMQKMNPQQIPQQVPQQQQQLRQSNTPEISNAKLPPSGPRDSRDSADRDLEKGNNGNQNYRDRDNRRRRR